MKQERTALNKYGYTSIEDNVKITVTARNTNKYGEPMDFYVYNGQIDGIDFTYPITFTKNSGFPTVNPPSKYFAIVCKNSTEWFNIGVGKRGEFRIFIEKFDFLEE